MSTNIHFEAKREIIVVKTGHRDIQVTHFNAWQTPTEETRKIHAAADPFVAYKQWVLSNSEDVIVEVFADDDILEERPPIATRTFNAGLDHINQFDAWLKEMEENGWEVSVIAW